MKAGERMLRKALQKLARRQTGKCVLMVQAQASVQVVVDAARTHTLSHSDSTLSISHSFWEQPSTGHAHVTCHALAYSTVIMFVVYTRDCHTCTCQVMHMSA